MYDYARSSWRTARGVDRRPRPSNTERQGVLDGAAERRLIDEATARVTREERAPPGGWLGPWISQSRVTPDLLAEAGYRYLLDWCMDDQPIRMRVRGGGSILAVPYPQELNDIPMIVGRKIDAATFADMIVDNFDDAPAVGRPALMGIALRGYLMGQPYRLKHLRRAPAHRRRSRQPVDHAGRDRRHCLSPGNDS